MQDILIFECAYSFFKKICLIYSCIFLVFKHVAFWFIVGMENDCLGQILSPAIAVLWALSAALVPSMQRGSETARSLHIALNTLNVLLFVSQLPTGFDILLKVFEFTNWP